VYDEALGTAHGEALPFYLAEEDDDEDDEDDEWGADGDEPYEDGADVEDLAGEARTS
jgi:hypothetical protein